MRKGQEGASSWVRAPGLRCSSEVLAPIPSPQRLPTPQPWLNSWAWGTSRSERVTYFVTQELRMMVGKNGGGRMVVRGKMWEEW